MRLSGRVGEETFGFDRYLNQILYQRSHKWKSARDKVILRDNGCDLGVDGYQIYGKVLVHHMNPITIEDVMMERDIVFDPEYLITTCLTTHNAIHYGDENQLARGPIERTKFDTCPWKRG